MPPERIYTERLVLRRWTSGDARALKAAIDSSLLHLQEWMPWAMQEPSELSVIKRRLEEFEESFAAGREWLYGIFDCASDPSERELLGGVGLHPRVEPGGLEIGYWLRADQTGHGFAIAILKLMRTRQINRTRSGATLDHSAHSNPRPVWME